MHPSLNPKLREFWQTKARYHVLYGGRASGKSWDAAGFIIYLASTYCVRVVCCRQFLNRSGDSIYALLKNQIARFGLSKEFDIQSTKITHKTTGSHISFYGLFRNIEEVKSLEGVDICLLEEAANLTEEQFEILNPTFRKKGFMFIIVFNPRLATDFIYKRFVSNPIYDSVVKKFNYLDNPYLDAEYIENVINPLMKEDIESYNHIYLGEPKEDDSEAIIKRSWIMAAIDGHKKLGLSISGTKRIGFDVADDGEDLCATVESYGVLTVAMDCWKAKEDEILKSCTKVYRKALEENKQIIYDAIGVGASCGAKFNELGYFRHKKFLAGGAVIKPDSNIDNASKIKNKDFYANIKAQAWWHVSQRLQNTYNAVQNGQVFDQSEMLFIDSNCQHLTALIDELCTPKKSFDNAGRVMVESKKDLRKRDIKSPNLADAFIMANMNLGSTDWDNYR